MAYQFSYEFQNTIRDMSDVFAARIEQDPVTSSLLTVSNEPFASTKLEWLDDSSAPKQWTVTTAYTAGAGTIACTNTAGLATGMILSFELANGNKSTLVAKVGAITANTSFAITVYGGSTDQNLTIQSKAQLLDLPGTEGSDAQNGDGYEPVAKFNYIQLIEEFISVTYTAFQTGIYGINKTPGDIINYLMDKKMIDIAYKIGSTSINMPRVQRSGSEKGTMGGWLWFLKNTASVLTSSAGAASIDSTKLNVAFEQLRSAGSMGALTIVAHPIHAKKFTAMNQNITKVIGDAAGNFVPNFITDFGDVANIVYSSQMDKDTIAVINPSMIVLRPFVNDALRDEDATLPGSRMLRRRIHGQYSLEVRNVVGGHALITGVLAS